jgi:surface polysaccharide O-acyltransferase-like enzyme
MPTYNYRIDAVKFFSIIAVVLIHVSAVLPSKDLATISNYYIYRHALDISVPFFFAVSGYFLASKESIVYISKYAKKIFIMYLAFSLLYIFLNTGFALLDRLILKVSFWGSFKNLSSSFSIVNLLNGTIGSYHLWFLTGMVFASLLLYVCIYFKLKPKTIFLLAFIFYSLNIIDFFELGALIKYGGFPKGFFFLSMGYFAYHKKKDLSKPLLWFILSITLFTAFKIILPVDMSVFFLAMAAFSLLSFSIQSPGKKNLFSVLGGYTLSIYILHVFVLKLVNKSFIYLGFTEYYTHDFYVIFTTIISVFLPIIIFKPIDKWFITPVSNFVLKIID